MPFQGQQTQLALVTAAPTVRLLQPSSSFRERTWKTNGSAVRLAELPTNSPEAAAPWASLVAQMAKNPPAMQEIQVWSLVGKIPLRRECLPPPVFLLGEFHGQRWLPFNNLELFLRVQIFDINECVRLSATPWTVAHQAPPSMEFFRQEYWSGLPLPSPGDLPDPGIEPRSLALEAHSLPSELPGMLYI